MRPSVVWWSVLFLWLACGGSAAVAGEAEWKADMQAGQAAYGKGDYRSATARCEAVLKEAEVAFGREHTHTATSLGWRGCTSRRAAFPTRWRRAAAAA